MKKLLISIFLPVLLSACGTRYTVPIVTERVVAKTGEVTTTTHTENSYIQKTLSANQPESCKKTVADLTESAQRDYMLLHAAGKTPPLCDIGSVASGRNFFDMKTEKTTAIVDGVKAGFREVAGVAKIDIVGDTIGNVTDSIGRNASKTTYNTDLSGTSQSNSSSGAAGSGAEGSNGSFTANESGIRSNTINIGGNSAVAGERAASGDTALVNGDSSLQSFIEDSELKQSPLADEQNDLNNSNGEGFGDNDGGNGVSLDL